jgi:hypothetical protein
MDEHAQAHVGLTNKPVFSDIPHGQLSRNILTRGTHTVKIIPTTPPLVTPDERSVYRRRLISSSASRTANQNDSSTVDRAGYTPSERTRSASREAQLKPRLAK